MTNPTIRIRITSSLAQCSRGKLCARSERTDAWITPRGADEAIVDVEVGDRIMVHDSDGFSRGGTAYYRVTADGPEYDGRGRGKCRVDVSLVEAE